MVRGAEILMHDSKGREIIKKIERKNYSIKFVRQDNLEEKLDRLYEVIAQCLCEDTVRPRG